MPRDDLLQRLSLIYTAIDLVFEADLTKFPPTVIEDEDRVVMRQDFRGGRSDAEIENLARSVIANIASFRNHLRRWAAQNDRDQNRVDQAFSESFPLQVITDLWNAFNHSGPPRDGGHSGKAPKLVDVNPLFRWSGGEAPRSVVVLSSPGAPAPTMSVSSSGSTGVVITGKVVDSDGAFIGDLHKLEVEAIEAWDQVLREFEILT